MLKEYLQQAQDLIENESILLQTLGKGVILQGEGHFWEPYSFDLDSLANKWSYYDSYGVETSGLNHKHTEKKTQSFSVIFFYMSVRDQQ